MIPVLILTGFLGSGKTTLLNHLLGLPELAGRKISLIINEFGALNIDAKLVRDGDYRKYEINRGSIFCICTQTDFVAAAREIGTERPDWVIIEATGVAETADIERFLCDALPEPLLQVRACLALVDCTRFITLAATMKTARRQVMAADGLIFNKTDLADPVLVQQTRQAVQRLNSRAPQIEVDHAAVPWSFIELLEHRPPDDPLCSCRDDTIYSLTLESDHPIDRERFERWLERRNPVILRAKGNARFADTPRFIELAAGRIGSKPPVAALGDQTRLVLIASGIEPEILKNEFNSLSTQP